MWRRIILLLVSVAIATGFGSAAHAMPGHAARRTVLPAALHCLDGQTGSDMHHRMGKGLVACACCNACSPALAEPNSPALAFWPVLYGSAFLIAPVRTPPGAILSPDPFPPRPARIG